MDPAGYDALAQKLASAPPADGQALMSLLQMEGYELAPSAGEAPMGDLGADPLGGPPMGDPLAGGPPDEEPMSIESMRMGAVKKAFGKDDADGGPPKKKSKSDDKSEGEADDKGEDI